MNPKLCDDILNNKTENTVSDITNNTTVPCFVDNVNVSHGNESWFGYGNTVCGYCDANCVYSALELFFVVGVFANALVIARVVRDKKLQDTTFIGIATLALPDLLFLLHNLVISFETVIISYTCQKSKLLFRPWYILNSMIWFSANSHVALLSILRFISIAYPIKSSIYLTPKRVIMFSAVVWALGIILLGTLAILITFNIVFAGATREFIIIWWITVYLIPLIVTSILHVLKLFLVKKATLKESNTLRTRRSLSRMAKIVPLIIVSATVFPLPNLIFNCILATGKDGSDVFPSKEFELHFEKITHFVYLLNHLINPLIYGFLSKRFRNSVKEMFPCFKRKPKDTTMTDVDETRSRYSSVETVSRNVDSTDETEGHKTCVECVALNVKFQTEQPKA